MSASNTTLLLSLLIVQSAVGWTPTLMTGPFRTGTHHRTQSPVALFSSQEDKDDNEKVERTSFDQAGASLIEEEDQKRMEQMGDFDSNDSYQEDAMEKMRAAIRERAADMGIEKSKVTADYIARREKQALEGGPPGAQSDPDSFGGLDLTQISQVKQTNSDWDEDMPTMFYDAADDLSKDEQEEVDPVMLKNPVEQGLNELANAKWPDPLSALREVAIMFLIVGFSTLVITNWDNVLRGVYTGFGFIPTPEEVANYANRFDGLDLPSGWTSGMTDTDVQTYADTISTTTSGASGSVSGMPGL